MPHPHKSLKKISGCKVELQRSRKTFDRKDSFCMAVFLYWLVLAVIFRLGMVISASLFFPVAVTAKCSLVWRSAFLHQLHAALGTVARFVLDHFRVHRA